MGDTKNESDSSRRGTITWDEEVIAEHDKLRGTRMKIDEPDTPFERERPDGLEDSEEGDSAAGC